MCVAMWWFFDKKVCVCVCVGGGVEGVKASLKVMAGCIYRSKSIYITKAKLVLS